MEDKYIKTVKELRKHIGDMLFYTETCSRYSVLRSIVVDRLDGNNVYTASGDVKWMPDLRRCGLRTFKGKMFEEC